MKWYIFRERNDRKNPAITILKNKESKATCIEKECTYCEPGP